MALAAFLLVTTDDQDKEVREVGYIYLVATRIGTLCLFAMFAVLFSLRGDWNLEGPLDARHALAVAVFVLGFIGFGLKAGVMPLHVWLPGAHANAPSHVSAIMSGVLIKMGIYGLVRITSLFPSPPAWWGGVLLGLGVASGVLGVAFAIGQHDLKRLLAYHSIENIGIICMGLGLALLGRSLGRPELVVLGLAGGLLHVWNHGLFKALLFLAAGSVIHATGTREIDRLGGLAKPMPWTGLAFLVGAVGHLRPAAAQRLRQRVPHLPRALPGDHRGLWATLDRRSACRRRGAGADRGAGGGVLREGLRRGVPREPRSARDRARTRGELADAGTDGGARAPAAPSSASARSLVAPVLDRAAATWASEWHGALSRSAALAPLGPVTVVRLSARRSGLHAAALGSLAQDAQRRRPASEPGTAATPRRRARMQYTSSSFAEMLVGLFGWALAAERPRADGPRGLFPAKGHFTSHVPDTVLDRVLVPGGRASARGVPLAALGSARERAGLPALHPRHPGLAPRSGSGGR